MLWESILHKMIIGVTLKVKTPDFFFKSFRSIQFGGLWWCSSLWSVSESSMYQARLIFLEKFSNLRCFSQNSSQTKLLICTLLSNWTSPSNVSWAKCSCCEVARSVVFYEVKSCFGFWRLNVVYQRILWRMKLFQSFNKKQQQNVHYFIQC